MQKNTLLFIVLIVLATTAVSQTFTSTGTIYNQQNQPIANASVKLLHNDSLGSVKYFAITNSQGIFSIDIINTKQQLWLQVSSVGYISYNKLFTLTENINIVLQKFTGTLPEINIKSDLSISKRGDTTTYKVSAFERGNENNIADLLAKLPGVQVSENGKVLFNGKLITRVLLESDDLTGGSYNSLINNATINGIDKIDVIENYKDNTRIETNLAGGSETVLNLRYKQKAFRTFGNISLGCGLPIENYEVKFNAVSFYKKSKLVILSNKNTISNLACNLFGKGSNNSFIENETAPPPFTFLQQYSPFSFSDVTPINISAFRVFANNSSLINANYFLKPSSKFLFKASLNKILDNYQQTNTTIQTYYQIPSNYIINQVNYIEKNNNHLNYNVELNWQPKPKFQIILLANYNSINNNQFSLTKLNMSPNNQAINEDLKSQSYNLTLTKILTYKSFLKLQYVYKKNSQYSSYNISNPILDSSFKLSLQYNNLLHQYNQPISTNMIQLSYFTKIKTTSINIKISKSREEIMYDNNTILYNKIDSLVALPANYFNNSTLVINKNEIGVSVSKNKNYKLQTTLGAALQYNNVSSKNGSINSTYNLFVLPNTSIQYKFNNTNSISFYAQGTPCMPSISNLNNSYVFNSNFIVSKASGLISFNTAYLANLGYSYNNISSRGYFFYTFFMLSSQPINYIANTLNSNRLIFYEVITTNRVSNNKSINIHYEKSIYKLKSVLVQNISLSSTKSYSLANSSLITSNILSINAESRFRTNWKKWFNFNTAIIFRNQYQKNQYTNTESNVISGYDFLSNTLISIKPNEHIFIDIQNDFLLNHSFNNQNKSINFTDIKLRYVASKKVVLDLLLRNILNKNEFAYNYANIASNSINTFQLNQRLVLLSINYKF